MARVFFNMDGKECCNEELALSILLKEGILFANSRKFVGIKFVPDNSKKEFHCEDGEIKEETIVLFVICNDLFAWGTADGENITLEEIPNLYKSWANDKHWGVSKWCCKKRNLKPQKPIIEDMKKDGVWDSEMEKLK